ncbi:hypothetical protein ACKWTF_001621 [Chironomus riparius]
MNNESILTSTTDTSMDFDPRKKKFHQKSSKSHSIISNQIKTSSNRKSESLSTPTINRPNENQNLSRTSIDSELDSHLSICNSDSLTDNEIIRKHVSFQKNAATNYSINDCPSSIQSSRSRKQVKSRFWTKFLCCK